MAIWTHAIMAIFYKKAIMATMVCPDMAINMVIIFTLKYSAYLGSVFTQIFTSFQSWFRFSSDFLTNSHVSRLSYCLSKGPDPFCWFHRVYGIQNDQLNLTVILAEKSCKIMHYSRRYLRLFDHFSSLILQISLPTKHYFAARMTARSSQSFCIP